MKSRIYLVCVFIVVATSVFSQKQKKFSEMSLEELLNSEIVTASAVKEIASESPATTYLITSEDISDRGYMRLLDVLEDIPEFELQLKSNVEWQNEIVTRGISGSNKLMILLNGSRINSGAATKLNIDYNYDIRFAEKIEIVMGPASAVYGADAFTGVINIITAKGYVQPKVQANLSYGNFGTTSNNVNFGFGTEEFSISGGASYYGSAEPSLPDFYKKEYAWYNNEYSNSGMVLQFDGDTAFAPISKWEAPKTGGSAMLNMRFKDLEVQGYYNSILYSSSSGGDPKNTLTNSNAKYGYDILGTSVKHNFVNSKENFTAEHMFSYIKNELNPQSNFQDASTNFSKGYRYEREMVSQINAVYNIRFNEIHRLSFGWTHKYMEALPMSPDLPSAYNVNVAGSLQGFYRIGSNILDPRGGRSQNVLVDFFNYKESTTGGFIQLQENFSGKFFVQAGARLDYNSRFGLQINPRVGFVYKGAKKFSMKATYGEAFLSNTPSDVYGQYGSFEANVVNGDTIGLRSDYLYAPNPDLKPQKMRSVDFSANVLAGDFSATLNAYYNNITNLQSDTTYFNQTYRDNIPVAEIQSAINLGSAYSYGLTLKLEYKKKFENLYVSAYGMYSYSNGKSHDDDFDPFLLLSSKHNIKIGGVLKWKRLSLSPRLLYRSGAVPVHQEDDGEPGTMPAYFVLNAHVSYSFIEADRSEGKPFGLNVFFTARNITDNRYYNSYTNGDSNAMLATPQDPFRFVAGVKLTFLGKPKN